MLFRPQSQYPVPSRLPVRLVGELDECKDKSDAQTGDEYVENTSNVAQRQSALSRSAALQHRAQRRW